MGCDLQHKAEWLAGIAIVPSRATVRCGVRSSKLAQELEGIATVKEGLKGRHGGLQEAKPHIDEG